MEELEPQSTEGQIQTPAEPAPADHDASGQAQVAPVDAPPALSDEQSAALVEAILFATDSALPPSKIVQVSQLPGQRAVKQAVQLLNQRYEQAGCSFRIEEIGGGYQMLTQPQFHEVLNRLHKVRDDSKLTQAARETLAIIAYRQPILRADVEAIRGVASGEVLRGLMEKQMVKIVGRAEVIGRPMLYGTTRRFLEVFGLGNIEDLPRVEELKIGDKPAPAAAAPQSPTAAAKPATPAEPPAAAAPAATDSPMTANAPTDEQQPQDQQQ